MLYVAAIELSLFDERPVENGILGNKRKVVGCVEKSECRGKEQQAEVSGQRGQGWVGKILGTTVGDMQPAFLALVLIRAARCKGPAPVDLHQGLFCRRLDLER